MAVRRVLPAHHLNDQSKDVLKLAMGLVATMAAVVLGLVINSEMRNYDDQQREIAAIAANIILLDTTLARYGPEAAEARQELRGAVARSIHRIWPGDKPLPFSLEPVAPGGVGEKIRKLVPHDEEQRAARDDALRTNALLLEMRWTIFAQKDSSIPPVFLVVLVFWLTVLFACFGLFAAPNTTVIVALVVCALSVSSAIFLILELGTPYEGLVKFSSAPMLEALSHLGR